MRLVPELLAGTPGPVREPQVRPEQASQLMRIRGGLGRQARYAGSEALRLCHRPRNAGRRLPAHTAL